MSQQELLAKATEVLTAAGIDYMVTGSMASSVQGEPRFSHDIDLVVALKREHISVLLRHFPPPDYYLSEPAMIAAIDQRQMFNVLAVNGGEKIDFWMLTQEPFDQSRFARRQWAEIDELRVSVSSPEDTILAKLRWAKLCGGSEKQFTDALRVYELQQPVLDFAYLEDWIERLELQALWARLKSEAGPPDLLNEPLN